MLFEIAIGRKPTANGNKAEEKCPHFKDKTINTNADRIRAMSDEELADVVVCPHIGNWDLCRDDCKKCRLEWLKQPVGD